MFGSALAIVCGVILLIELATEKKITGLGVALAIATGLGIGLWVYDVSSPIETTEHIVQTNDLERYGIKVEVPSKEKGMVFNVKITEEKPTRFGTMWNDRTSYTLVLSEGEEIK